MYIIENGLCSFEGRHSFSKPDFVVLDRHFGAAEIVLFGDIVTIVWSVLHVLVIKFIEEIIYHRH
jgi:hypothetical protein